MASLEQALNDLAQKVQLTVNPAAGPAGNAFNATLSIPGFSAQPPVHLPLARGGGEVPPLFGELTVTGTVEVRKIVDRNVNLKWISENVRFVPISDPPTADDLAIPPNIIGPMPIQPSIPIVGAPIPTGVPGAIGLLKGTIPVFEILLESISPTVSIEVHWRVLDENKVPVSEFAWSAGGGVSGKGTEFVPAPDHVLDNPVKLRLIPPFTDLASLNPVTVPRWIQAHLRLSAAGITTPWIDLETRVSLPAIAIPTLLFLFRDPFFKGAVLIVFPKNSPLGPDFLIQKLTEVRDALSDLHDLLGFVAFFIKEVNLIIPLLENLQVAATRADEISNLNDVDVITYSWYHVWGGGDIEAEDEMASLIFLGPPGRVLQAFNDRNFSDDEGQMNINIGLEMAVAIETLYSKSPISVPPARVSVPKTPQGCRGTWCFLGGGHKITTFGDEFSSIRFG
jgi:hypothetical protein